jgi:hypothetical protein
MFVKETSDFGYQLANCTLLDIWCLVSDLKGYEVRICVKDLDALIPITKKELRDFVMSDFRAGPNCNKLWTVYVDQQFLVVRMFGQSGAIAETIE